MARVEGRSAFDFHSRFLLRESPAGEIHDFRGAARRLGVTVNDLFLSAMAMVCAELAPISRNGKRPDVGLGTIVDLRPSSRVDLSNTFGLFLGFTSVIARPGDLADLSRLIQSIAAQNRLAKKTGVAQASPLRMAIGLMMGKIYSPRRLVEFYRKRMALAAGISNVNLTGSWLSDVAGQGVVEYVRVSPVGPMLPMVFTPTTLDDRFHVGLTYRSNLIDDERAEKILAAFFARLRQLSRLTSPGQN